MRVTGVRIFIVTIGGRHPVLVEVQTDDGVTGVGEAGVAYGTGATAAAGMVKDLAEEFLLGADHAPELEVRGGMLPVPSRPGLGVTLVEEKVKPFVWAVCRG